MKKYILLFLLAFQFVLANEPVDAIFKKANDAYNKENYEEALIGFEKIAKDGNVSADLYFNIGNCYYKLGKIAPSIYNYEKALLLNPDDEAIQTNLSFAQKMRIDDIKIVQEVGFKKLVKDFTSKSNYDAWAWTAVVIAFLSLLAFLGYYFGNTVLMKRLFFTLFLLSLIGIGVTVFSAFLQKKYDANYNPAIVFAEATTLKSEPKNSSEDVVTLHEGTKVLVLETLGNWKQVELSDKTKAWIAKDAIKEVKK
ncbi:tetratricopeptide repeat protein [Flavobacterium psychraquaticum]|uniref:tetratricopeptide repeat protein n=1 Tax=Flavobacterium psychraquaticum TaxID=3103958 RepID=UPI002ACDBF71|nr:tetratricopeptide repeat protein [Flavobacterium sp. LB-N7T]